MSYFGIDVSEHNGKLDWAALKSAGVQYAIIRTGYGKSYTDPQFHNNVKGAIAQGIPVGVYHFSYAGDADGAKREAEYVISLLAPYRDKITLPVFFDFEYDTVDYVRKTYGKELGRQAFNDHTVAFCEVVKAAGYIPGVYYNLDYYTRFVDKSRLVGYVQWYAQYNKTADISGWDIWQYDSTAKLGGHSCDFDVNTMENAALLGVDKPAEEPKASNGYYYYLKEVPAMYRDVLDKLIAEGKLKGRGGSGEELVLDMSEEMVRALVIMNR